MWALLHADLAGSSHPPVASCITSGSLRRSTHVHRRRHCQHCAHEVHGHPVLDSSAGRRWVWWAVAPTAPGRTGIAQTGGISFAGSNTNAGLLVPATGWRKHRQERAIGAAATALWIGRTRTLPVIRNARRSHRNGRQGIPRFFATAVYDSSARTAPTAELR